MMSIRKFFSISLSALAAVAFTACDSNSGTDPDEDSSSSVASFKSSSSFSDRADMDYKGEIELGDTMRLNIELFDGDSSKMDESEVYIDSFATSIPLFLGKLEKGSRIKILASTGSMGDGKIRVRSESGDYLNALTAVPKKAGSADSTYENYFVPNFGSDSTAIFKDSNEFVVFKEKYYYIEVSGDFSDNSTMRLKTTIDTAYYKYVGDTTDVSMKTNDVVRGIVPLDDAPEYIGVNFNATQGYSINLKTLGTNITKFELDEGDSVLGSYTSDMDTLLVTEDSVSWSLRITPEAFANIYTGPYAFFEATTKSRELEQGEYFAFPDSIKRPGEEFLRTRPKDDPDKEIYKYNLRQEQYVWLGDYEEGDSVQVEHTIYNYSTDIFESPVTIEILDKNQEPCGHMDATYGGGFKVTKDMPEGPYYLHYLRLNSYPLDNGVKDELRYVLQLSTLVQELGVLESMSFLNTEKEELLEEIYRTPGDTLRLYEDGLDDYGFEMIVADGKGWDGVVGQDVRWYVPCSDLSLINNGYKKSTCEASGSSEQRISASYLYVQDDVGETAHLIAESVADPTKRDTLSIEIIAKAE